VSHDARQAAPAGPGGQPPRPTDGLARDMARNVAEGVAELVVRVLAFVVLVGVPAWLGYLVADGVGLLVGAVLGLVAFGVLWVVLLVMGVRLLVATLRRRPPA